MEQQARDKGRGTRVGKLAELAKKWYGVWGGTGGPNSGLTETPLTWNDDHLSFTSLKANMLKTMEKRLQFFLFFHRYSIDPLLYSQANQEASTLV